MFGKPTHPEAGARATVLGTLTAMFLVYLSYYATDIFRGSHLLDYDFLRRLSLIALIVIGFGWWENHR